MARKKKENWQKAKKSRSHSHSKLESDQPTLPQSLVFVFF
jgi:hypothetical protein